MIFKKVGCVISLVLLLSACASSLSDREIRGENYAAALYYVSYYENKISTSEVEKVSNKIKEKAGPKYQSVFFEDTKRLVKIKEKNLPFFKDMLLYLSNANITGLLNDNQIIEINNVVYQELAVKALLQPSTVPEELRKKYPDLQRYMVAAHDVEYGRALSGDLPSLNSYVSIYEFIKSKDQAKAETLLPSIRKRIAEVAESSGPGSRVDLDAVISLYAATNDSQVRQSVAQFVLRTDLSKKQIRNEVAAVLPDLASQIIAKREILVNIVSDSNDSFIDELPKALEKVDEWITIDDDAKRKLTIARLRITERPGSPIVRSQTLGSPDIATLLFIPKNASVLYDTLSTSYEISWSMNVTDSSGRGSKVISGKKTANKFECSNIRFKNVFGGEGPLNFVPAGISAHCSAQSNVDFDGVREMAVMEIASEIAQLLKKDSKLSATSRN